MVCRIWNFKPSYRQLRTFLFVCFFVSSEEFMKRRRVCKKLFIGLFEDILQCFPTFPGMCEDIPWNAWRDSPECLRILLRMSGDNSWNVWRHSPICLVTFPGMFVDIPWNITFPYSHSPHSLHSVPRSCTVHFLQVSAE